MIKKYKEELVVGRGSSVTGSTEGKEQYDESSEGRKDQKAAGEA